MTSWIGANGCIKAVTLPFLGHTDWAHKVFCGPISMSKIYFPCRPSASAMVRALELLLALGALDSQGNLTLLGRQMVRLPVEPVFAKVGSTEMVHCEVAIAYNIDGSA